MQTNIRARARGFRHFQAVVAWSFFSTAHAEDRGEVRCGEGSFCSV